MQSQCCNKFVGGNWCQSLPLQGLAMPEAEWQKPMQMIVRLHAPVCYKLGGAGHVELLAPVVTARRHRLVFFCTSSWVMVSMLVKARQQAVVAGRQDTEYPSQQTVLMPIGFALPLSLIESLSTSNTFVQTTMHTFGLSPRPCAEVCGGPEQRRRSQTASCGAPPPSWQAAAACC